MRAIAYIDGFNLYYGAVRHTPYKWLNLRLMCEAMVPEHEFVKVCYFTARVKSLDDPAQPQRQDIFLQALRTIPNLEIVEGRFLKYVKRMRLAKPIVGYSDMFVSVIKFEEKGSDVNIASWMLRDGFLDAYDTAVVVTNDSDLVTPISIVRNELGKDVIVINPQKTRPSNDLRRAASSILNLRLDVLQTCQLPETITLPSGKIIHKPPKWETTEE